MKNVTRLILATVALLATSASCFGYSVSFGDNNRYWGDNTSWSAANQWNTDVPNGVWDGNKIDVIGDPNISGGTSVFNTAGRLMSVTFNFTSPYHDWRMIAPGNLFINVLKGAGDTKWDYVVNTMGDAKANQNSVAGANYTLAPSSNTNHYYVYDISSQGIDAKRGVNDNKYVLSGADNTGYWAGYYLRNNHPIGLDPNSLPAAAVGETGVSGFGAFNGVWQGSTTYDFTSIGGLDTGAQSIILAWEMTCANDVVYEEVRNPVPEPSTMLLFGAGLVGVIVIRRKMK